MVSIIYLDNAATTQCHEEVIKEMLKYFNETYGNPSSLHSMGQDACNSIESARIRIANLIGAKPNEIIFTSGGTESDNIAILGTAYQLKNQGTHLITSNIEHPAVRNTFKQLKNEGFDVTELSVNSKGIIKIDELKSAIRKDTILISIMHANNEIGTIQPIEKIAQLADENNIIFHTDAIQTFSKIRLNLSKSKIDLLSASAHKIMGPKGIGMLYIRNNGTHPTLGKYIKSITYGGYHEFGYRPSTQNVPGIMGFTKAIEICHQDLEEEWNRQKKIRDAFIQWVLDNIPETKLNGALEPRLSNNINFSFRYIEGESLLLYLNSSGFQVSTGSACSSHSIEPSHVIQALGLDTADTHGSLRITLGRNTISSDLEKLKLVLKKSVEKLRNISPLGKK